MKEFCSVCPKQLPLQPAVTLWIVRVMLSGWDGCAGDRPWRAKFPIKFSRKVPDCTALLRLWSAPSTERGKALHLITAALYLWSYYSVKHPVFALVVILFFSRGAGTLGGQVTARAAEVDSRPTGDATLLTRTRE